jgi:hypothetical protein
LHVELAQSACQILAETALEMGGDVGTFVNGSLDDDWMDNDIEGLTGDGEDGDTDAPLITLFR